MWRLEDNVFELFFSPPACGFWALKCFLPAESSFGPTLLFEYSGGSCRSCSQIPDPMNPQGAKRLPLANSLRETLPKDTSKLSLSKEVIFKLQC